MNYCMWYSVYGFSIDHQSDMAQILSLWTCRVAVEKIELSAKPPFRKILTDIKMSILCMISKKFMTSGIIKKWTKILCFIFLHNTNINI